MGFQWSIQWSKCHWSFSPFKKLWFYKVVTNCTDKFRKVLLTNPRINKLGFIRLINYGVNKRSRNYKQMVSLRLSIIKMKQLHRRNYIRDSFQVISVMLTL